MKNAFGIVAVCVCGILFLQNTGTGAAADTAPKFKKYDIQSGVVKLSSDMQLQRFSMQTQRIIYFDNWGMKERREIYKNGKLTEVMLSDGETLYTLNPETRTAIRRGKASRGTEIRIEFMELGSQKDREAGLVKRSGSMTVAGKTCETFDVRRGNTLTRYAGWKKFMVYMKTSSSSTLTTVQATEISENAVVAPELFRVPKEYTVQK